ncbi:MAG: sigma 54-interacting transcriptional regulator, partial [Desulfovibrio sp.]|jgi:propionate catabolism operon transcriptional regulator|nr:sigma 54-interacting transcriptional regulator [Desulfovibrio sp.]
VAINCAALPESLLESELFGYEEGAFTGARKGGKPGLFEMAHTGTIFLDEMGELSQNTQLRLLRVLENREVIRVGGGRVIPVDIRIISASHKSLPELIRNGQFRPDLFYRLAVLRLETPPLRHRLEDIPCLLEKMLEQYSRDDGCLLPGILDSMHQYHWPGNVRELRAVMESYLIMLGSTPHDEELFLSLFSAWSKDFLDANTSFSGHCSSGGDLKSMLEDIRRNIVQETVTRCAFNKKKAAQQLGISYNTLWRILNGDEKSPDPTVDLANPSSVTMGIIDPAS